MLFDTMPQFLFSDEFLTKLFDKYEKDKMISVVDISIVSINLLCVIMRPE